jgi:hypothetical protein
MTGVSHQGSFDLSETFTIQDQMIPNVYYFPIVVGRCESQILGTHSEDELTFCSSSTRKSKSVSLAVSRLLPLFVFPPSSILHPTKVPLVPSPPHTDLPHARYRYRLHSLTLSEKCKCTFTSPSPSPSPSLISLSLPISECFCDSAPRNSSTVTDMEEFEYTLDNEQQFWDGKLTLPHAAV